jgi:glycosyltransferase involved in cell wall biosynthesis
VVHCGLDHQTYRPDPAVAKAPQPTVLFVGRLRRYKRLDWVMRSLPQVRVRVPQARLVVIGDGPHGAVLREQAAALGVADAVEFRGFATRADKVRALQESWVLVQPSPKEGWGLTVVEAGACATAVVAADSPGLRDSVRRDLTGLLVPYSDVAWTWATRWLSSHPARAARPPGHRRDQWAARFTGRLHGFDRSPR